MKTYLPVLFLCLSLAACATQRSEMVQPAAAEPTTKVSTLPGPEMINAKTCVDDAWLLTHYDVVRLASGSSPAPGTGYPIECCADGVLHEDDTWRCELDWPSSDVPDCSAWTEYHDTLVAAHPEGARSARVQQNLATLKKWVKEKHHCSTD